MEQIFSECLQAQEALQLEKEENMRLNHYMEQILEVSIGNCHLALDI
jgi:hypothetical protein